jgi:hypothetical protein
MLYTICIATAALGVAAFANGNIMLTSPAEWYFLVPGVATTGPYNQHFIRDIGLVFRSSERPSCSAPQDRNIGLSSGARLPCGWALTPSFTSGKSRSASAPRSLLSAILRR